MIHVAGRSNGLYNASSNIWTLSFHLASIRLMWYRFFIEYSCVTLCSSSRASHSRILNVDSEIHVLHDIIHRIYGVTSLGLQRNISPAKPLNLISPDCRKYASVNGSVLVQIIVCRLFGAKPLSNQCWVIVNWTLLNKLQWNFNQNTKLFIHKNGIWIYHLQNGGHFVQTIRVNIILQFHIKLTPAAISSNPSSQTVPHSPLTEISSRPFQAQSEPTNRTTRYQTNRYHGLYDILMTSIDILRWFLTIYSH